MTSVATAPASVGFLAVLLSFLPLILIGLVILAAIIVLCVILARKKNANAAFNTTAEFPHKT